MKNEPAISSAALEKFSLPIITVFKEKLEAAFQRELEVYEQFFKTCSQALSDYSQALANYRDDRLTLKFLSAVIQLHRNTKEALENSFDAKEALYLEQAVHDIEAEVLALFSQQSYDVDGELYRYICAAEEQQFAGRPYLVRVLKRNWQKLVKKPQPPEGHIHAFLYYYYRHTAVDVLLQHKEALYDTYRQLAAFLVEIWNSFDRNTAIVNKLHIVGYQIDALDADIFKVKVDHMPGEKLKAIKEQFQHLKSQLLDELKQRLLHFDFTLFQAQKTGYVPADKIVAGIDRQYQQAAKSNALWRTTRFAFTEDMVLDLEIYLFKYQIAQQKLLFVRAIDTIFNKPFYEGMEKFAGQFKNLQQELTTTFQQALEQKPEEAIRKLRLRVKRDLFVKTLPQMHRLLNSAEISQEIEGFENLVQKMTLSTHRMLMKKPDYTRKVKPDELEAISPSDLVAFEIMPDFMKVFPAFKRAVIKHIQILLTEMETAPQIFLFSIESAGQYVKENEDAQQVANICIEGLKRSMTSLDTTGTKNREFFESEIGKFESAVENLVNALTAITNNESAFQIKMRVMRAKALKRSREIKDRVISSVVSFLPRLFASLKILRKLSRDYAQRFSAYFDLEPARRFIDADISDHLSATHIGIKKLPYIYQRLFSFEPLETFELYTERKMAMEKLELAFSRWKEEKFAPVIIVGEKGSGKTTFINKFLKGIEKKEHIVQLDLVALNKIPEELYPYILQKIQPEQAVHDEKKIVVLDGLERLYESRINGAEFLLKVFELISKTQKEIFWIVAVHSVSWSVFDKSIEAANYFGYHISMNELDITELSQLIMSRHKLSGYPLVFTEKQKKKGLLRAKTSDWEEQQNELRDAYFNELNKRVQGNILQTFIYWMRSASLIDNSVIQIESESILDYSFVRSIASDKLILFKQILIHSGISVPRLAKILRCETADINLQIQQLIDDGLLSPDNGVLFITPLVYKQIVKHMQDINLIH